jgi:O-antigen biosynthesis protein WbqP
MKRLLDLTVTIPLVVILTPVMAVVGIVVFAADRGPVLHWSRRIGRGGCPFMMPKFRSMKVGTPQVATDRLSNPVSRLTPVGGLLRTLSLDELPQLWSVIRGDMSLVGPRPALFNQDALIAARKARGIHTLRPGITGWAQVNGRDDIPESRKIELDEQYLHRHTLWFDLTIICLTVKRVVWGDGVSH